MVSKNIGINIIFGLVLVLSGCSIGEQKKNNSVKKYFNKLIQRWPRESKRIIFSLSSFFSHANIY